MGDFVVEGLDALGPPVVLAQQEAVVGADDEERVLPEIEFVHQVEDFAQVGVAHADRRGVFVTGVLDLLRRLGDFVVAGPVEVGAVVVVGVEVLVLLLGEVRLVRIEGFDVEEPVVVGGVGADELHPFGEGFGLRLLFLACPYRCG